MTADRWRKIEGIYDAAMDRPATERAAYVSESCGNDSGLRSEIEALLAQDEHADAMLDRPAWELDQSVSGQQLAAGARLGPYEVIAPIGAGGMGLVFRARDTRLQRIVAIKIAKARFSGRFEREAKAIAALNHPNVCTLYDVGPDYLVMEHVEGERLTGPLPLPKAIELACQILDALDAAHKRGIVHRDLKPANILVTKGGVKVLDFGLALMVKPLGPEQGPRGSETRPGMIAGTLAYMAPEQLQGREVDVRADIFAFGCVLFEMLAGRRAFEGSDAASVISAVMERPAPSLEDLAPPAMDRVLKKCLEKDPDQRWESARDLKTELVWAAQSEAAPASIAPARRLAWVAATLGLAIAGAVLGFVHFREKPLPPASVLRFAVVPPGTAQIQPTALPVLSPDGHRIAFGGNTPDGARIVVEDLITGSPRVYSGAVVGTNVPPPFWSPDGRSIAYSGGTKLQRLDTETGEVTAICDKPGPVIGGSWNSDGVIIFGSTTASLWTVRAAGGTAIHLTKLDAGRNEVAQQLPQFLPDGRHFIYFGLSSQRAKSGIVLGSLDSPETSRLILPVPFTGMFVPADTTGPARLVWYRNGELVAQPFDLASLTLRGNPEQVVSSVGVAYNTALFSVSRDVLVYRGGGIHGGFQFVRLDPKTGHTVALGEPGPLVSGSLSPDGTRLAYTIENALGSDIRILDITRGTSVSLTFGSNTQDAQWPVWSPDGKEVAYTAGRGGRYRIFKRPADGSGSEQLVFSAGYNIRPVNWSADGRYLLIDYLDTQDLQGEGILPLAPGSTPFRISHGSIVGEACGAFSPNGKYIAYCSEEEGHTEVYVKPFIPNEGIQTAPRWLISDHGGRRPLWSRDSRTVYYWSQARHAIFGADISDSNGFHAARPVKLYDLPAQTVGIPQAGIAGGEVIVRVATDQTATEPMNVVVNWRSLLTASGK